MLTEQKRYLFPPFLLLNYGFAFLFCMLCRMVIDVPHPPGQPDSPIIELWEWSFYYLIPVLILLTVISKKIWYTLPQKRLAIKQLCMVLGVSIGGLIAILLLVHFNPFFGNVFTDLWAATDKKLILITAGYVLSGLMVFVFRWALICWLSTRGINNNLIISVLIFGADKQTESIAAKINAHPEWGMRITGFLVPDGDVRSERFSDYFVQAVDSSEMESPSVVADMVLIPEGQPDISSSDPSRIHTIVQRCHVSGLDVGIVKSTDDETNPVMPLERFDDLRIEIFKRRPDYSFYKRFIDVLLSIGIISLSLPVWLIIPILIRLDSRGPVIYRGIRVGKNGRRFYMYKFRSMVPDAEQRQRELFDLNEMDGPVFKIKKDPRITRFGHFLRQSSLDELPQLYNVIKGDMSLVGPRPPIFRETTQYHPWEKRRLSVIQGITGFWQVSGRNEVMFDEWVKLDLMYIDEWSFMLDFFILLKTPLAVIARKGAH